MVIRNSVVQRGGSSGGSAVSSVFGRTGAVTAQASDYASFYIKLNGTSTTTALIPFALGWSAADNCNIDDGTYTKYLTVGNFSGASSALGSKLSSTALSFISNPLGEGPNTMAITPDGNSIWVFSTSIGGGGSFKIGAYGLDITSGTSPPSAWILNGAAAVAGSASNTAGGEVSIRGGASTGTGISAVTIYAAPAGSSGTSGNSATLVSTFTADNIIFAGNKFTASSAVILTNTTDSTANSNGAIKLSGGMGIAKNLYIGGNIACDVVGKTLLIKEGTNGMSGNVTLVAGVATVSISGLTSTDNAYVARASASGTVGTGGYTATCTSGTLTITSIQAALTTQILDTSVIKYVIIRPS